MNDFKCPMCTDCPDNCPLDTEEDTREYSADYYKGKADGAREFAEWLEKHAIITIQDGVTMFCEDEDKRPHGYSELLAEWQKGYKEC